MKDLFQKILYWLEKLSSRPKIGGLQISDSALQYVLIEKDQPRTAALRLPPGVIKAGRIQNRSSFIELLRQLHQIIEPDKNNQKIRVIVSLPLELVFSQSFSVPNIDPSLIDESARLNLQIISPLPPEKTYASWQLIDENPERYEFLGALIEKQLVDEFTAVLNETNFIPIAFEFPALALTRLINRTVTPEPQAILVLNISSDGLDLFILKNGKLYFDHFRSWLSIQGESRQITKEAFELAVIEEVQKVINFSINRFKEWLTRTIIIAPGFESEIGGLLKERFGLAVTPLTVRDFISLGPSWFIALGSALRGLTDRSQDQDISLTPLSSIEEYKQEQTFRFVVLWRNIIVGAAAVFFFIFVGINMLLVNIFNQNQVQLENFKTQSVSQELTIFQEKVQEFNRLTAMAEKLKFATPSWLPVLEQLQELADRYRVRYDQIIMNSTREPVQINARAPSSAAVVEFKNAFSQQPNFKNVDLPLVSVNTLNDGSVGFNLSFSLP